MVLTNPSTLYSAEKSGLKTRDIIATVDKLKLFIQVLSSEVKQH